MGRLRDLLDGGPRCWLPGDDPTTAAHNARWLADTARRKLAKLDHERAAAAAAVADAEAMIERFAAQAAQGPPLVSDHLARCGQLVREAESTAGYADRATVAAATLLALDEIERTASAVKPLGLTDVDAELRQLRERTQMTRTGAGLQAA